MPCYKGEKYLRQALDSVLAQTMQEFEIVAVEDVSPDKTWDILQDYASKYPEKVIAIKHEINKGQAGSLNTALARAKGRYICTLDVDDVYEPTKLEEQSKYLDEHTETAVVYSNGYYLSEDGTQKTEYNSFEYDPQMLHRFNFIPNGSAMIRRLIVLDVGGFDETLRTCQDYDLWLRVQSKGYKIEKMPIRSFCWRQHSGQKSRTKLLPETLKMIHDKWKHTVVSIVVPVYNCERYIKGCLESILAQKCSEYDINQRWECIIVDDASTDKTGEIAQEYVRRDDRFRYFRNEQNMGIGYTRNRGIDEAKGDFICFLSADDEMLSDYVLAMIKTNQFYPDAILYSDYVLFDDNGNVVGETRMPGYQNILDLTIAVVSQAELNKMFVCYNCFAPASIWRENKFDPELRFGEDLEHLLRCILLNKRWFIGVKAPLFKYRVGFNTTTTKRLMDIPENNKIIKRKINEMAGRIIFEV
jgi:glycosyltransferase involved in cell wall biosynthesis